MVQTIDLNYNTTKKASAADKLLDAAGPLFADRPFDVVSTREISEAAGVNLSAISYHFGNKEGLYEAIFRKIIEDLSGVRETMTQFVHMELPKIENNTDQQRVFVGVFIHAIISAITDDRNPRWRMRLMIQEVQRQGPCFDLVLEKHINVMHDLVGRFVSVIVGKSAESEAVKLLSQAILGLCLQYGLNEALLKKRLNWQKIGPGEIETIKQATTGHVWSMLGIAIP